jgi:hypothetical protein
MKMSPLIIASCLCRIAFAQNESIGFEVNESYSSDSPATPVGSGWTGVGSFVTKDVCHGGNQALTLPPQATATKKIAGWPSEQKVAWVDFWVRPVADRSTEAATTVDIDGAKLAFIARGQVGEIFAWDGKGEGLSMPTGSTFDIAQHPWIRVTIREDFMSGTWDLFVDGRPIKGDIGFDGSPRYRPSIWDFAGVDCGSESTYLDDIVLSANSVLFDDRDNDGLPDAYERAHGLDSYSSNRGAGDPTGELFAHFVASIKDPASIDGQANEVSPSIRFVDNLVGSDENSGLLPYPTKKDGPKASIKATISESHSRTIVVVLKGTGLYHEGSYGVAGKSFTLTSMDSVKIQ